MEKIIKNAKANIEKVKKIYGNSSDLTTRIIKLGKINVGIMFMESSSAALTVSEHIIKSINMIADEKSIFESVFDNLKNRIFNSQMITINDFGKFPYFLSSGFTIIVTDDSDKAIVLETRLPLDRGVTESSSEPILRGPKDSFTESHAKNLGLIRKRIKDENLWFEEVKIGRRTKTRVNIAYINDIVDKKEVKYVKNILKKIDIDGILDSGNLREYLINEKSAFPQVQSTERPDLVCQSLLNGKIAIIVENSPFVLLIPAVFIDFIHTPEDYYQKPLNISLTRILKFISLLITLFTPAIYIAITTFDQIVVPNELLISLAVQRESVPFPTSVEIILLMTIFEILRESDIRMPSNMGTAMSIVGALVLGQAAVDAGIVSPIAVIVVAFTSICSLIFTDIDFMNGIRFWRFIFIIAASFLGLIGVVIAVMIFIFKLASLENFGVSYLSPFSPFNVSAQKDAIVRFSMPKIFKRPNYMKIKNFTKQGGEHEK